MCCHCLTIFSENPSYLCYEGQLFADTCIVSVEMLLSLHAAV